MVMYCTLGGSLTAASGSPEALILPLAEPELNFRSVGKRPIAMRSPQIAKNVQGDLVNVVPSQRPVYSADGEHLPRSLCEGPHSPR
jgi:hypothetical protein